jgi:hypothetical protein
MSTSFGDKEIDVSNGIILSKIKKVLERMPEF